MGAGGGRPKTTRGSGKATAPGKTEPSEDFLVIGKVLKHWGLKGSVKVFSYAESPDIYGRIRELYLRGEARTIPLIIESAREQGSLVILKFRGRDRIEDVADLTGKTLYMHKADLEPLPEGEYYWHQLIGMEVLADTTGRHLGTIEEIMPAGSHDVYVVRKEKQELLIPAIRDVILEIDVSGRRMIVHPLEGMLDEDDL